MNNVFNYVFKDDTIIIDPKFNVTPVRNNNINNNTNANNNNNNNIHTNNNYELNEDSSDKYLDKLEAELADIKSD